jgi:hypothetical protein
MLDVTIGLVNMESAVGDVERNLQSMEAWADQAATAGVEILWCDSNRPVIIIACHCCCQLLRCTRRFYVSTLGALSVTACQSQPAHRCEPASQPA